MYFSIAYQRSNLENCLFISLLPPSFNLCVEYGTSVYRDHDWKKSLQSSSDSFALSFTMDALEKLCNNDWASKISEVTVIFVV